jgi:outer membrane protein TolC
MKLFLLFLPVAVAWGQDALSLREAVQLGLRENKSVAAAAAGVDAAAARIRQARAGTLPKVQYSESFTRSNNPVYVFGSLLTQHQFETQNFAIPSLNRPDSLNNFQSLVTIDQPVYDAGLTRNATRSARLAHELSGEQARRARTDTIAAVDRAYFAALLAAEHLKAAEQAVRSAEADLARAESIRDAGMSTDLDVLSIKVHLAAVREQRIQRSADVDVARAALNDALGLPLDTQHTLTTPLEPLERPETPLEALERGASESRPETRELRLATGIAKSGNQSARSALRPTVAFHGAFEADRQQFINRGGANWLASVSLRWNLFNGFADKGRIEETSQLVLRAEAEGARADSAVRLQVRRAHADFQAAKERIAAERAAVEESEESLRITKNRYAAGLSNVTDLIRNETAVLDTRTRYLAAIHDERVAAAMLEYAAGTLTADSEVLK